MARVEWLIADLRRQRRTVAEAAARARVSGLATQLARQRFFARTIGRPTVLAALFTAGVLLGLPGSRSKGRLGLSVGSVLSAAFWAARLLGSK
jgi:hypothetical protein